MPYVNVKLVKGEATLSQKQLLIDGLMDIIVNKMGRNPDKTVIILDEIEPSNWFIGRKPVDKYPREICSYIEIRISKGTSNAEQMAEVIKSGKELVNSVLGSCDLTNYFIINELNPDSWGFDGISMSVRNMQEQK